MNHELYEKLTRLQWLLHKQQMRSYHEDGLLADTTRGQGRILAVLQMKDGISTKELAYLLGLAVSSLNELLSKLEKGNYITRQPSEQDKRVMLVKLTEKGRNTKQGDAPDLGDVFACLSDDEQKAFGEYLERVIAALEKSVGFDEEDVFERMRAAREHFGRGFRGFGGVNVEEFERMAADAERFNHELYRRWHGFGQDRRERGDDDDRK